MAAKLARRFDKLDALRPTPTLASLGRRVSGSWFDRWAQWWRGGPEAAAPMPVAPQVAVAPARSAVPSLRPGLRVYAIGDIHGYATLFDRMMQKIEADLAGARLDEVQLVFLGDFIDRGPDSAGVIERLSRGDFLAPYVALRGNHEDAMLRALDDPEAMAQWCQLGGDATMASYGVDVGKLNRRKALLRAREDLLDRMPNTHRDFLNATQFSTSIEDYFFAHAGARPGVDLARQAPADLMWIRDEFLSSDYDFGKVIVHGHTPRPQPESRSHRINVDTGAFKWGTLTAVALEGTERRFLSVRSGRNRRGGVAG